MDSTRKKLSDEVLTINQTNNSKKEEILQEKEEPPEKIDTSLMFDKKHISIFKLFFHISGPLEIFLSIIALIMTICAGCSNAAMNWLFGDTSNNFSLAAQIDVIKEIFGKELLGLLHLKRINEKEVKLKPIHR